MMVMGLFAGVGEGVANFFRDIIWDIVSMQIWCIQSLINALCNGVLSFGILDNTWILDGYTACIALMFIVLPVKLAYEVVFAMVRDDDQGLDVNKKLFGTITCIMIAVSLSTVVPLANNLSINVSKALIGQQYSQGTSTDANTGKWNDGGGQAITNSTSASSANTQKDLSKELVVSTLCAFGGMDRNNTTFSYVTDGKGNKMDLGAERFYEYITNPDNALQGYEGEPSEKIDRTSDGFFSKGIYNRWSFYYRWDTDGGDTTNGTDDWDLLGQKYESSSDFKEVENTSSDFGARSQPTSKAQATKAYKYISEHSGEFMWDFGYIGTIIGLAIFMILLFIITIEVAMRIIMIGFLYIIGPLCCMSLTNFQNPQAFLVWKNTILGMFLVNVTQIFMLQFLMNIASDIAKAGTGNSNIIASIALYFGTFSAIISLPKYVQSMIGGYGAGMMEAMGQLKGTMGAMWGMTGGLALGAGKTVMGKHNDNTGHLTGGLRGKVMGNKNWQGEKVGGVANRSRAIRDGIFGKAESGANGPTGVRSAAGGAVGAMGAMGAMRGLNRMKKFSERNSSAGSNFQNREGHDFSDGDDYSYQSGDTGTNFQNRDSFSAGYESSDTSGSQSTGAGLNFQSRDSYGQQSNSGGSYNESHTGTRGGQNGNSQTQQQQRTVRQGGLLGRDGVVDKTVQVAQNPKQAVKRASNKARDAVGYRGSGMRNWKSMEKRNNNNGNNSEGGKR